MVNLGLSRVDDAVAAKHPGVPRGRTGEVVKKEGRGPSLHPPSATPGTRGVCRMPVTRLHEGRFHLRHSCRLCGQLWGDKSGVEEMQQPLALPGDRAAPQRHEHRSAKLGQLRPGHRGLGAVGVWNTAFMPPDPRLTLPTP
ncbi:transmembrane protein 141 isoform X1 [Rhinopithecus roxellana]|uniref:transmembrane protein 141 isoform X1 n=1 Tax=Rhinopithecus roxellana TaxID=61622 RepID=UPI001237933F|nr:transmembrane protein 141 isoform X1 [Rhinopithecus roxellana]